MCGLTVVSVQQGAIGLRHAWLRNGGTGLELMEYISDLSCCCDRSNLWKKTFLLAPGLRLQTVIKDIVVTGV